MDDTMFADLLQSVRGAGKVLRGEAVSGVKVTEPLDIKALRETAHVSQTEFALLIGVSKRTLENWEQRRTTPSGPARALLKIVSADPKAAIRALHTA
jgi:putative transcriptional regulator